MARAPMSDAGICKGQLSQSQTRKLLIFLGYNPAAKGPLGIFQSDRVRIVETVTSPELDPGASNRLSSTFGECFHSSACIKG